MNTHTLRMAFRTTIGLVVGLVAVMAITIPALAISPIAVQNFISDDTIDVNDGTLEDWPEGSQVIDEEGVTDVTYNTWCFTGGTWDDSIDSIEACGDGLFYNGDASMDIQKGNFGVNDTNLLMGLQSVFPMMAVWDGSRDRYVDFFTLAETPEYSDVTELPEAYDHTMVFAFGPADEEVFDYYMIADITFPQDLSGFESPGEGEGEGEFEAEEGEEEGFEDVALKVYQESGDTLGWQEDEDTVLTTLDPEDSETSSNDGEDISPLFEVKLNAEKMFDVTGMDTSESYGFRFETHSFTDVSERVVVDLGVAAKPAKVKKHKMKNRKVRVATATWTAIAGASSYNLELRQKNGDLVKAFSGITKTKKKLKKKWLKANGAYKYRVQAVSANNVEGEWSTYKAFRTKPKRLKKSDVVITEEDGMVVVTVTKQRGTVKKYIAKVYDADGMLVEKVTSKKRVMMLDLEEGSYTIKVRQRFNKKNMSAFSPAKSFIAY